MTHVLVGAAGALGTVLRYALGLALAKQLGGAWPYGTFAVNVIGSCLLGMVAEGFRGATWAGVDLRLVLGTGVLGGFTTYSSFNLELLRMLDQGAIAKAAGYLGLTVGVCLTAGWIGMLLVRLAIAR